MEVAFLHVIPGNIPTIRIHIIHNTPHPPYRKVGLSPHQQVFVEAHMHETAARIYEMMLADAHIGDTPTHPLSRDSVYCHWLEQSSKQWRLDPDPKISIQRHLAQKKGVQEIEFDEAILFGADVMGFVVLDMLEEATKLVRKVERDKCARIEEVVLDATCALAIDGMLRRGD